MPATWRSCLPVAANSAGTVAPTVQPCAVAVFLATSTPSSPRSLTEPDGDVERQRLLGGRRVDRGVRACPRRRTGPGPSPIADTTPTPGTAATTLVASGLKPSRAVAGPRQVQVGVASSSPSMSRERRLQRRREHAHADDQGEADHQRRRRRCGTTRVAHRVLPGQVAGHAAQPQRPADRRGERPGGHRRQRDDADQSRRHAEPEQLAGCRRRTARRARRRRRRPASGRRSTSRIFDGGREPGVASRSASTGSTLVARRAGTSAATTVTRVPTRSDTQMVRGCDLQSTCVGRLKPSTAISAFSPLATPTPSATPTAEAPTPSSSASVSRFLQHLAPGGADRPQQRDLARPLASRSS